jgi:hypothetical protein
MMAGRCHPEVRKRFQAQPREIAMSYDGTIVIRASEAADAGQLHRLAALDSVRPITGPALVAEVAGSVLAALPLNGGRAIADPFSETAHLVELLEAHASVLNGAAPRPETRGAGAGAPVEQPLAA